MTPGDEGLTGRQRVSTVGPTAEAVTGCDMRDEAGGRVARVVTRRRLLQTAAGAVAVTVLRPGPSAPVGAALAQELPVAGGPDWAATPGVASQRIDGRDKVTGRKVYARDFRARDMAGWPAREWQAIYLPALTTEHAFLGLDLSGLPPEARPAKVVTGDMLAPAVRAPKSVFRRDLMVDAMIEEADRLAEAAAEAQRNLSRLAPASPSTPAPADGLADGLAESFNDPSSSLSFDLVVVPGNVPNYLGQAVALLLFDSLAAFRAAERALAFDDARWQLYDPAPQPSPGMGDPYMPLTDYVRYGEAFSYATADPATYSSDLPQWRAKIAATLAAEPGLIRQPLAAEMQAMDPMFMEPEAGLGWYDPAGRTMHLVLGTQSPDGDVANVLSMYGNAGAPVEVAAIELTSCYPGGGFGGRDSSPFTMMLALATGYTGGWPVRLAHDRYTQFRVGLKRHAARLAGEVAVRPDMTLQAVSMRMEFDGGGRKNLSPYVASLAALCAGGAYRLPMGDIAARAVHTQNITGGSQRGFGGPQAFFALETALDELAAGQGWDPLELRRANLIAEGDTTVVGGPVAQELRLGEMLDIVAAHPLWRDRAAIRAAHAAEGRSYGTGLALSLQAYGTSGDGMVAAVTLDALGRVGVQSDAVDMGNGSATTLGVVVGPILGANASRVEMGGYTLFGQTGLTTSDPDNQRWQNPLWTAKSVGSSSACLTALHQVHVAQQTALALLRGAILPAAAQIWGRAGVAQEAVRWEAGLLLHAEAGLRPLSLAEIAAVIHATGLPTGALGHGYFQGDWAAADFPTPGGTFRLELDGLSFWTAGSATPVRVPRSNTTGPDAASSRYARTVWAPCANVVGLTADPVTGLVQVENVLSVLNAGRVHVPELVSGQSQGGIAMALGYTLLEDMPPGMAGPADGRWNLDRYHVARAADVPLETAYRPGGRAQELVVLPETPGDGRAGRGIAEAVMCAVAPAISNALREALGRRYSSLPITPEKILKGLAP